MLAPFAGTVAFPTALGGRRGAGARVVLEGAEERRADGLGEGDAVGGEEGLTRATP
jgi:hypothetical protein